MTLIDTHAHIYDSQFADDQTAMLDRAEAQQISQIWMPNCARETIPGMMALADQFPDRCLPMMGLHPAYVNDTFEDELATVEDQLNRHAFMAVGEIGLDFYWDMTFVDQQFVAFETQLRWAADSKSLTYIETKGGVDNLWAQPIEGGQPKQITSFVDSQIFAFDWAQDGGLVASRGVITSDVVLIRDAGH